MDESFLTSLLPTSFMQFAESYTATILKRNPVREPSWVFCTLNFLAWKVETEAHWRWSGADLGLGVGTVPWRGFDLIGHHTSQK